MRQIPFEQHAAARLFYIAASPIFIGVLLTDDKTTIVEMKGWVTRFNEERDWMQFEHPKDIAMHVSSEAAEILEHFVYKSEEEVRQMLQDPARKGSLEEEAADVLWALLRFACATDIDLSSALAEKLKKTAKKYPVEKAKGSNKKHTEL